MKNLDELTIDELKVKCRNLEDNQQEYDDRLRSLIKEEEQQEQELLIEIRKFKELEHEYTKDPTLIRLMDEQYKAYKNLQNERENLINTLQKERKRSFADSRCSISQIQEEIRKKTNE